MRRCLPRRSRAGGVHGLLVRLATDGAHAPWCAGTLGSPGTRLALLEGARDVPDLLLPRIDRRGPTGAAMPARTARLALGPIECDAPGIQARGGWGWPGGMGPRRPEDSETVRARPRHPPRGVPSTRRHARRRGAPVLACPRLLAAWGALPGCPGA